MRYGLLLFAFVATAQQDPRGFVNERLLRQNFAKNALTPPTMKPLPTKTSTLLMVKPQTRYLAGKPQDSTCAIPLLAARLKDADPKIAAARRDNTRDEKMIVPTMPPCPAK